MTARDRRVHVVAWFLAISYGLAAPTTAIFEYLNQTLSKRFDLPPALIYVTCAVQLACAMGVLARRSAVWSAGALTFTTIGAIASHVRIGSAETAIVAVVYTAIQIWFGLMSRDRVSR